MYHRTEGGRISVLEGGELLGRAGRLSAEEAADIYGRAVGKEVDVDVFRDWLRNNREPVDGFERGWWVGRWEIDKAAMLDELERRARLMLAVVEEERRKGRP